MKEFVWINGEYQLAQDAKISIYDRGLIFADAVYEVFLLSDGKIFDFRGHFKRLVRSLNLLEIKNPISKQDLQSVFDHLIEKNQATSGDYAVYLQISRGNQKPRKPIFSNTISPNIFVTLSPTQIYRKLKSIKVALEPDIRWGLATIKTTNLLANSFLISKANNSGFDEVIMHKDGLITEATGSSVFIYKNNCLDTPELINQILPGTTRQIIIDIARGLGVKVCERKVKLSELTKISELDKTNEIWLSSSTKLLWFVNQIDEKILKNTRANLAKIILKEILAKINLEP